MADMLSDVVCSDSGKKDHEMKNNASALEQPEAAQNLKNVEQEADPQRAQQWEKRTRQRAEKYSLNQFCH